MNSKTKLVIVISVAFIFLSVSATENHTTQWKGTIEEQDGVKVIKNPNEPLYEEITFDLEEDLCIGNEEDENYAFYRIGMPVVDSEGNILVLDRSNYRIQKYSKDGKYLLSIGRRGQGPGEFERPFSMYVDTKQNIYVRDVRDLDIFDKNGKHIKSTVQYELFGPFFGITKDGNIIAYVQLLEPKQMLEEVVLIDEEGEKIKTIVTYKSEGPSYGKVIDLGSFYTPGLCFYPINEECAVYGYSSEYKLFVIDSTGKLAHIIEKDEPPTPLSKKEINKVIDDFIERQKKRSTGPKFSKSELKRASKFPKHMAFYRGFNTDDKNRIYVNKFKSRLDEHEGGYFDIFSKDGYYLYRAKISPFPYVIKNGYVYTTESDQDTGFRRIKRYKIKNWDQIKEQ